jgi:hypothetical protein
MSASQNGILLSSKAQYTFDTLADPLTGDNLLDMKTADLRYITQQA